MPRMKQRRWVWASPVWPLAFPPFPTFDGIRSVLLRSTSNPCTEHVTQADNADNGVAV